MANVSLNPSQGAVPSFNREAARAAIQGAGNDFTASLKKATAGSQWGSDRLSPVEARKAFDAAGAAVRTIVANMPKNFLLPEGLAAIEAIRNQLVDALPPNSIKEQGWKMTEVWSESRNSAGTKEDVAKAHQQNRAALTKLDQVIKTLGDWSGDGARSMPNLDLKW